MDSRTLRMSSKLPIMTNSRKNVEKKWSETIRIQRVDRQINAEDI